MPYRTEETVSVQMSLDGMDLLWRMNAINVVQAITANFVEDGTEIACTKIYKKVAFERSCII